MTHRVGRTDAAGRSDRGHRPPRFAASVVLAVATTLVGCVPEPPVAPTELVTATAAPRPTSTPRPTPVDPVAALTLEQRVGQLFLVGTPADAVDPLTLDAVAVQHAGGVFLAGRSSAGVAATAGIARQFQAARSADDPPLWIATDQEGGDVQVLSGEGFSAIPTALTQAERFDAGALRGLATQWGAELVAAGVSVNLAPVVDIVTTPDAVNPPIGWLHRQYGFDRASVVDRAAAVASGLRDAGVLPTLKHFPGLGRVLYNTDTNAVVVDEVVGAGSDDVAVYRDILDDGPALVMMSSATYTRMDPSVPALFSFPIVTGILRGELGFDGVVMTDDVSAADSVSAWPPADRATLAIAAGVDVVLVSADPMVFDEMYQAVLDRARTDPAFAATVDAAARRVVEAKTG